MSTLTQIGKAGLSGLPGKVASKAAGPVARHTPMTRDQVLALFGAVIGFMTLRRLWKSFKKVRAAEED